MENKMAVWRDEPGEINKGMNSSMSIRPGF